MVHIKNILSGKLALANLAILLGIFICYLPVLLGSGISFLTDVLKPALTLKTVWHGSAVTGWEISLISLRVFLGITRAAAHGSDHARIPGILRPFSKTYPFLLFALPFAGNQSIWSSG